MNWLNLQLKTLRSSEYLGADPTQRATWINLLSFCADHENAGFIAECVDWNDRKWMQLVGVTRSEVMSECELWSLKSSGVMVAHYPNAQEQKVKRNRRNGKKGGRPSADKADGLPHGSADGSVSLKRNSNSNSNRKGNSKEESSGVDALAKKESKATANSSIAERDAAFLAQFNRKLGKKFRVMPKKASHQLTARLKEGYTADEIVTAALACSRTEYHRKNKHHLTPEFITRDDKLQVYAQMNVADDNWVQDRVNGRGVQNMQGHAVNADGLTLQQWKEDRDVCAK